MKKLFCSILILYLIINVHSACDSGGNEDDEKKCYTKELSPQQLAEDEGDTCCFVYLKYNDEEIEEEKTECYISSKDKKKETMKEIKEELGDRFIDAYIKCSIDDEIYSDSSSKWLSITLIFALFIFIF